MLDARPTSGIIIGFTAGFASFVQDVFDLPDGGGDYLPYSPQLVTIQLSSVHLTSKTLTETYYFVTDLLYLRRHIRVPSTVDSAPDVFYRPPVLFKKLPSLVGYGVDLLAVSLRDAGLGVGQDVAIVGFNDVPLALSSVESQMV